MGNTSPKKRGPAHRIFYHVSEPTSPTRSLNTILFFLFYWAHRITTIHDPITTGRSCALRKNGAKCSQTYLQNFEIGQSSEHALADVLQLGSLLDRAAFKVTNQSIRRLFFHELRLFFFCYAMKNIKRGCLCTLDNAGYTRGKNVYIKSVPLLHFYETFRKV